jgi:cytochrome b6-f complex iron-sulfur subunit
MSDTPQTPEPAAAAPASAPAKPAAPAKAPAKAASPSRRAFLGGFLGAFLGSWIAVGFTTMTLSLIGMVLGTVRFLFPNVLSEPPSRFKVGFADDYEEGKVVERYKDQNAWVVKRRDDQGRLIMYALSTACTHLGCTPNWLEREAKFKCPCHGSGFYITGINFEGPAPRPLERWGISIAEDGQVLVDKSKPYKFEAQEWNDPNSYILV